MASSLYGSDINLEVCPMLSGAYYPHLGNRNAIVSGDFSQHPIILSDFKHLRFSEFMHRVFLAALPSSMKNFVSAISTLRIVAKIFKPIVSRVAIIVADVTTVLFSHKSQRDYISNFGCPVNPILRKRYTHISATAIIRTWFQYSASPPASYKRPNATEIADHVKSLVPNYFFPDFIVHVLH